MSGFQDMLAADVSNVFLNQDEFSEPRTIQYDGETYEDVAVVLTKIKESDRPQLVTDHAEGLYLVSTTLHCALHDLDGVKPEKGGKIVVYDGDFPASYYVASSAEDMGMLRLELEAIDE